jgi:pyruvate-formate lyase-activating enzyme
MSKSDSSRPGFLPTRVIHLHPSRFCNLACRHCYSASGPHERGALAPEAILAALAILRREGYEVLSLSGGEPLLYAGIATLVPAAVALGFRVNLVSNGAPLGGRLLDLVAQYVNLVAISLDGAPETHNHLRGDPQAFQRAERAMDRLNQAGVRYGLAYCVSRDSLSDMPWAVDFAQLKGAALVQFHPFAATGRGQQLASQLTLDETDKARAYLVAALLENDDGPALQLDLAPVAAAQARRQDYAVLALEDARSTLLSDLVNPLIMDETGTMLPFCYGISPHCAVGRLGPDLATAIQHYKTNGCQTARTLLDAAFSSLGGGGEQFVDWFFHLVQTSYALASPRKVAA